MQSIYELDLQSVVNDVKSGSTCVLMKPKGMKIIMNSPPDFQIMDKKFRSLNIVDLLSTDLYIGPYTHLNKIKSKLIPNESYEIVHNYDHEKLYLVSVKDKTKNLFINDYRVMFNRANLYDIDMPIIPNLDIEGLISLITAPELYFTRLHIAKISDSVMFLNKNYQATLQNPHKEKSKPASSGYETLLKIIIKNQPESLDEDMDKRFHQLLDWCKRTRDELVMDVKHLGMPNHAIILQDFTMTFLPNDLYKFLKSSRYNVAIFRIILMLLLGKGFTSNTSRLDAEKIKSLNTNLNWTI